MVLAIQEELDVVVVVVAYAVPISIQKAVTFQAARSPSP
jgi:hypothetical protein